MMHLLPGDRLWNRFEVERGGGGECETALLRPCVEGVQIQTSQRWLLLSLHTPERHPLIKLLSDLGSHWRLNTVAPSRASRKRNVKASATPYGATLDLELLPQTEWIGDTSHGGVALVPLLPSKSLQALLKTGSLSAAQALPLAILICSGLHQLFAVCKEQFSSSADFEERIGALPWLCTPDTLVIRTDNATPALRVSTEIANWRMGILPPAWCDYIAPEMFSQSSDARKVPAALVFAAARLTAYVLGMESAAAPGQTPWTQFALWTTGKHDPATSWATHSTLQQSAPELHELIGRALSVKPGRRPQTPEAFATALRAFFNLPWAQAATCCSRCGFVLKSAGACTCCGELRALEQAAIPARQAKGKTTAIMRSRSNTPVAPGMTLIEAGSFLSGEDKVPRTLRTFAIDTFPISEGDYKAYLAVREQKARVDGPGSRGPEYDLHPVTRITWYEANEFAEHYGKRLPTVFEWEKAARGSDGRKFPFGETFKGRIGQMRLVDESGRRQEEGGTAAVGTYPAAASPYGVMDMAGNVLEWTTSARRAGDRLFRAVKGSCYKDGSPELARCTSVQYLPPETSEPYIGFRCVKDVE